MIYDQDISTDISLSQILDAFIIQEESSKIIISFLRQHENDFSEILKYSSYQDRIFQLDFFLTCSIDDQIFLLSKLKEFSIDKAAYLTWQVLKSDSGNSQSIKYLRKSDLSEILAKGPKHPYGIHHEHFISYLDNLCFKMAKQNRIADIPILSSDEKYLNNLRNSFKYIHYSLFQNRLLQYDFFINLDLTSKFLFIKDIYSNCYRHNKKTLINFSIQILNSDEDINIKKEYLNYFTNLLIYTRYSFLPLDIEKLIDDCQSFSEFMLKMTMFNSDLSQYVVLYLILLKEEWLREWVKYDKEGLDKILKISSLYEENNKQ